MEFENILQQVRRALIAKYGSDLLSMNGEFSKSITEEVRNVLGRVDNQVEDMVISHIIGLGPIDVLFRDPTVSEVMANGPDSIFVERNGIIEPTNLKFPSVEDMMHILHRVVQRCGRKINFSNPLVKARLPDGSRVNAVIPPSSPWPAITIRRFVKHVYSTEELLKQHFLNAEMVECFKTLVEGKANIVVAGATGCGKTTFMRWLCSFIPIIERIITIEIVKELALEKEFPHVVPLEATDKAGIHELMLNVLHMRPDRIILCEILGAEAVELLEAMGTGHDGSITTVHTNMGKEAAIHRMVRQMSKIGNVTAKELRSMIAETIDILIFLKHYRNGTRTIVNVCEVMEKDGEPKFRDIYQYRLETGEHQCVGQFSDELKDRLRQNLINVKLPDIQPFRVVN